MVIVSKYLIPKGYAAMAIFPFIILSDERYRSNATLVNHERIHLHQQAELLVLPFFIWYFAEYFIRLLKYRSHRQAYRTICFEAEAYAAEADLNYLYRRRPLAFIKFLKTRAVK